jgi:hypothetical protein
MPEKEVNATARCHPIDKADNRGVAEGEDGYFSGTKGLPVGIHIPLKWQAFLNYQNVYNLCHSRAGGKPGTIFWASACVGVTQFYKHALKG